MEVFAAELAGFESSLSGAIILLYLPKTIVILYTIKNSHITKLFENRLQLPNKCFINVNVVRIARVMESWKCYHMQQLLQQQYDITFLYYK